RVRRLMMKGQYEMKLYQEAQYTKEPVKPSIHVVDSIMGAGKTSWAIQHMQDANKDEKFIYITPFLSEVERVRESVTNRTFKAPNNKGKGKLDNLKDLIMHENDIVSTHALFQNADESLIELIRVSNYTLILDEVMNVIEQFELDNEDDFHLLLDNEMIIIDDNTGLIHWNEESKYQNTKYNEIKILAKSENLYFFENTILFWTFPVTVFHAFKEIYIMTYLFQAQQQRYYYDMHNVDYTYKAVQKLPDGTYTLVNHEDKEPYDKELIKSLIDIYDGGLNDIGDDKYAFSVSWFNR